jgi:hypothetical protein
MTTDSTSSGFVLLLLFVFVENLAYGYICFQWRSKWLAIFVVFLLFITGKSHCSRWYPAVTIILACLAFLQRAFCLNIAQPCSRSRNEQRDQIWWSCIRHWCHEQNSCKIPIHKHHLRRNVVIITLKWYVIKFEGILCPYREIYNSRLVGWMLIVDLKSMHSGKVLEKSSSTDQGGKWCSVPSSFCSLLDYCVSL